MKNKGKLVDFLSDIGMEKDKALSEQKKLNEKKGSNKETYKDKSNSEPKKLNEELESDKEKDKYKPKSDQKKHRSKKKLESVKKKQKSGDKSEGEDKNIKLQPKDEVVKREPELQPCKKEDCFMKKLPMGASYEAAELINRKHTSCLKKLDMDAESNVKVILPAEMESCNQNKRSEERCRWKSSKPS